MRARFVLITSLLALSLAGCADIMGMKTSEERNRQLPIDTNTDTGTGTGVGTGTGTGVVTGTGTGMVTGAGTGTGVGTGSVVTGSGTGTDTATTITRVSPQKGFTIAWMSNGTASSFFNSSRNGATAAGQMLTSKNGINVNVSIMDPAENKAATQAARIEEAVANPNVLGLAVDVIDPAVINPVIDNAVASGVTVMTFDSDAPSSKRGSYFGMDNRATGVTAAKILTALMGKPGDIAIMNKESPATAANFLARQEGFMAELANHPGFKVVVDLPCTDGPKGESTLKAGCAGVLEETMVAYPSVTGWFMSRGRPLRQANLAADAPNWTAKIKAGTFFAVAYDAIPESIANIRLGYVNAVINQKYYGWGYDVVALLFDVIVNKRSILPFTDSGFDVVCANNVEAVATAWSLNDFSKPLDKCQLGSSQWP